MIYDVNYLMRFFFWNRGNSAVVFVDVNFFLLMLLYQLKKMMSREMKVEKDFTFYGLMRIQNYTSYIFYVNRINKNWGGWEKYSTFRRHWTYDLVTARTEQCFFLHIFTEFLNHNIFHVDQFERRKKSIA